MSNDYENKILSAVDILIDNAVSKLNFDKTIEGTIYQIIDAGAGEYKVKYQDSVFTAYSESNDVYKVGTSVYVTIPGNDVTKDRIILGTTSKLTTVYTSAISELDKMIPIGSNIINYDGIVGLCSYHTNEVKRYNASQLNIKEDDINIYKKDANYLMIAANFKTDLDAVQKQGNGNYGMRVVANYHNEDAGEDYQRTYLLDINNMLGQPYNSTEGTRQYLFFPTNGNDFVGIEYLEVFCVNFPKQDDTVIKDDIFISNFEFYFTDLLNDDEVAGVALRLITPDGSYLTETETEKRLQATLKIKGVSVDSTKNIEYYWFRQDLTIDVESEFYSPLAGSGWYCLNEKVSDSGAGSSEDNPIGIQNDLVQYVPGSKEIVLNDNNCVFYKNIFKCVAVVDDVIITDQIIILNKRNSNIFRIEASEESGFKFKDTFELTLSAYQGDSTEVIDDNEYSCYWAAAADGGNIQKLENVGSVITVNPNIAEKVITYYLSVIKKDTNVNLGSAEITFVDASSQADYNLILGNADETFKYNLDGISPTNPQNDPKDRITIQPINFTVYDKNGRDIAPTAADKVGLNVRWYWPVENTMLLPSFIGDPNKTEEINNVEYYYFEVQNEGQVTFPYSIENRYNINKSNNTIFLKLKFKGTELIVSTNFTFVKEGEQGTNGTKYVCRIIPKGDDNIKQVFAHRDQLLYEDKQGYIHNYSGSFVLRQYQLGESSDISNANWEMLPNSTNFSISQSGGLTYISNQEQASIIQGYSTLLDGKRCYASYSLITVATNQNNYTYVVDGGWNEAIYDSAGERASYDQQPFVIKKVNIVSGEVLETLTDVEWASSWGSSGDSIEDIIPPKRFVGDINNYIVFKINNVDKIIYSVHLHYNRYSMAAMNDWDGNNLQINDAENSILAAQIAAGKKENDNSFTGVAIGETFQSGSSKDIGLFGYNAGTRTIFLNAKDGSAQFGVSGSCVKISANGVPSISYSNGNFSVSEDGKLTAKGGGSIAGWTIGNTAIYRTSSTWGASNGMYFGTNGISISNKFKVDSSGNLTATGADISGKITATEGSIGGWSISSNALYKGSTYLYSNGTIQGVSIIGSTFTSTNGFETIKINNGALGFGYSAGSQYEEVATLIESNGGLSISAFNGLHLDCQRGVFINDIDVSSYYKSGDVMEMASGSTYNGNIIATRTWVEKNFQPKS